MASFVTLFTLTDQGYRQVKKSPERVETAKKIFQDMGVTVKTFYAVAGAEFDMMFITEAPNVETVVKAAVTIASLGDLRPRTLHTFSEEELRKTAAELP